MEEPDRGDSSVLTDGAPRARVQAILRAPRIFMGAGVNLYQGDYPESAGKRKCRDSPASPSPVAWQ